LGAIAAVFTINYVAEMLGEDEDWLYELSIDMFAEDGCLHVYGVGEDGVTAFTEYGIECLKQIIADERADGRTPPWREGGRGRASPWRVAEPVVFLAPASTDPRQERHHPSLRAGANCRVGRGSGDS
jgi:hypothetical protein